MADEFDIVEIVFAAVQSADTGLVLYQNRSAKGEVNNHITVRTIGMETKDFVNKAPVVNVNIFIKTNDKTGMMNDKIMKSTCRAVRKSLEENITVPRGMYFKAKVVWSAPLGEVKAGFDCTNIRLEVITELN